MVWRVGNGCHIRVGLDPSLGIGNLFRLSEPLLNHMCEANISILSYVCVGEPQMRGRAECKDSASLGLSGDLVEECDSFIYLPCEKSIAIVRETEDSLCWSMNSKERSFNEKPRYKACFEASQEVPPLWWWKHLWQLKVPLRCKITLWLDLKNKILTWDNGIKRGWIGPNRCALCKDEEEIVSHLFVSCTYACKVTTIIK